MAKTWKQLIEEISDTNEYLKADIRMQRELIKQYDAEIRKPLEDEIERLKKENKQLIKDNRLLDKTKYTAQQDDIDFFVREERQKVIAELEKWLATEINKGFHKITEGSYLKLESRFINSRDLQQKLNEMKNKKMIKLCDKKNKKV